GAEREEQAAIDAGAIRAGGVRYVARGLERPSASAA
ncbi:MAG: hypothetical protein QOC86_1233, partial [Gaiellales bacterium]|nr:hypothetical protein [Gaiellales bacterium]